MQPYTEEESVVSHIVTAQIHRAVWLASVMHEVSRDALYSPVVLHSSGPDSQTPRLWGLQRGSSFAGKIRIQDESRGASVAWLVSNIIQNCLQGHCVGNRAWVRHHCHRMSRLCALPLQHEAMLSQCLGQPGIYTEISSCHSQLTGHFQRCCSVGFHCTCCPRRTGWSWRELPFPWNCAWMATIEVLPQGCLALSIIPFPWQVYPILGYWSSSNIACLNVS